MPSHYLILCSPLLFLPSVFPSIRVFSNESALHIRWPEYWSFSFTIHPSSEYSGLISFRMDWLDLLAVQGTLKSLFQHHSLKASILQHSAFITVQLVTSIHDYWKNNSLDQMDICCQSNVSVFNMLFRLVITFLPRSKHLLISWLQSPFAVILEPKEIKSVTVSIISHLFFMKRWDWMPFPISIYLHLFYSLYLYYISYIYIVTSISRYIFLQHISEFTLDKCNIK